MVGHYGTYAIANFGIYNIAKFGTHRLANRGTHATGDKFSVSWHEIKSAYLRRASSCIIANEKLYIAVTFETCV